MPGRSILLAEPDPLVADTLQCVLEVAGHKVILAPDSTTALRRLPGVDLLVTAWALPGCTARELLLEAANRGVPSIVATGRVDDEPISFGQTATLHKPFRLTKLLDAVRDVFGG